MQFHTLKRTHANRRSVQVGRGGKRGKTSGRGGKGQTARSGHKIYPQMRDLLRRIPKLRGRGKSSFKSIVDKATPINLELLETHFESGGTVSPKTLIEAGLLSRESGRVPVVKILGRGTLTKKITIQECLISAGAKTAVEKAGGFVHAAPEAKIKS